MSGKIRQQIPNLYTNLEKYIGQFQTELEAGKFVYNSENKSEVENVYNVTKKYIQKIEILYDKLKKLNHNWKKYLNSLNKDEKRTEEKITKIFTDKYNLEKLLKKTDQNLDILRELNIESKRILNEFTSSESDEDKYLTEEDPEDEEEPENDYESNQSRITVSKNSVNNTISTEHNTIRTANRRIKVKLPAQTLTHFSGITSEWISFWDDYESSVHNDPELDPVQKFKYLRGLLHKEPLRLIEAYPITNKNYNIVISLLKNRYGNINLIRENLHSELRYLRKTSENPNELRNFILQVNRILLQLQTFEEDTDHPQIKQSVEVKLPQSLRIRIKEIKNQKRGEMTTKEIMDYLDKYTQAREEIEKTEFHFSNKRNFNQNYPDNKKFDRNFNQYNENKKFEPRFNYRNQNYNTNQMRTSSLATQAKTQNNVPLNISTKYNANKYPNNYNQSSNNQNRNIPEVFCSFCQTKTHKTKDCKKYEKIEDRIQKIRELKLCLNCLKKGHTLSECKSKFTCFNCKKKHHTLICKNRANTNIPTKINLTHSENVKFEEPEETITFATKNVYNEIHEVEEVLMTTEANVTNVNSDKQQNSVILLDNASQKTYITEELAKKLDLETECTQSLSITTFNNKKPKIVQSRKVTIGIITDEGYTEEISALTVQEITDFTSVALVKLIDMESRKIPLALRKPDILIGIDNYWKFIKQNQKLNPLPSGFYVVNTKLGKILSGKGRVETKVNLVRSKKQENEAINDTLQKFWNLENIGVTDNPESVDEEYVLKHFDKNTQYIDGRYTVRWPFKCSNPSIPTNFGMSFGRLRSTLKRLCETQKLDAYNDIFKEQENTNIIEVIPFKSENLTHYLAHQPVFKESSNTTKLRIVFDASAKIKGQESLNDIIFQGPTILPELIGMLLRFRLNKYVLLSDLEKAFLQVALNPLDRDVCRFLWIKPKALEEIKNKNREILFEDLQFYRFQRIPFGINASPFLLAASIKTHLTNENLMQEIYDKHEKEFFIEKSKEKFDSLIEELKKNGYVDNFLMTGQTTDEIDFKKFWSKTIFKYASMNLREFISNYKNLNEDNTETEDAKTTKFLGIKWDINADELLLKTEIPQLKTPVTKREVLSLIATNYDPMGWTSPVILKYKLKFQQLWNESKNWNESVSSGFIDQWNSEVSDGIIKIPRFSIKTNSHSQIHIFADASDLAYASVAYLKTYDKIAILFSKTRLNPISKLTIPKLELMAVLISMRTIKFLIEESSLSTSNITVWSDSQCVLNWINSKKELPRFIKNRIKEIKEIKSKHECSFRYVPTKENPADIASRGAHINELKNMDLWWQGPNWLKGPESDWPENILNTLIENNEETNPITHVFNVVQQRKTFVQWQSFSSWHKVVTFLLIWTKYLTYLFKNSPRFNEKFKNHALFEASEITTTQRDRIEQELIKIIQHESPPTKVEIEQLCINPNENGILLCGGRLKNADLPAVEPIFLPKNHYGTHLLAMQYHTKNLHSGTATTLADIRNTFWIPQGRTLVNKIRKECRICRRYLGRPFAQPIMPQLPKSRVNISIPFSNIGLDYMGPFTCKEKIEKIWIILFTCYTTRGIHLELVESLSVEKFINAFRRFIARKGTPRHIWSDNASQLKHSSKILPDLLKLKDIFSHSDVKNYFLRRQIIWHFTIESAPWQGGCYERLNQVVKNSLRITIGRKLITYDTFQTFICEIEALVNSRPITFIYNDISSPQILRPIDFLLPQQKICIPPILEENEENDPNYIPNPNPYEKTAELWKKTTILLDKYWKLWKDEYLKSLRERYQILHKNPKGALHQFPAENDIVIIQENLPRAMWKTGKIKSLITGNDEIIRGAVIELPNKTTINRPLKFIYPLEIHPHETDNAPVHETRTELNEIRKKATLFSITNLVIILLLLIPPTIPAMYECPNDTTNYDTVMTSLCVAQGIIVKKNIATKEFCFNPFACSTPDLFTEQSPYCDPKCECSSWAHHCTFYDPRKRPLKRKVLNLLRGERPYICSFRQGNDCSQKAKSKFQAVRLYDNSVHFVKKMRLQYTQAASKEAFICLGEGNLTIGTSSYCREFHCDEKGTKFCYYDPREKIYLIINQTRIPIKEWGTIEVMYFDKNKKRNEIMGSEIFGSIGNQSILSNRDKRAAQDHLLIECTPGGITINILENIDTLGVCSGSYCVTKSKPQSKELIILPQQITKNNYDAEVKLIVNNSIIETKRVSCASSPICEMITCKLCWEYIKNVQCIQQLHLMLFFSLSILIIYLLTLSVQIIKFIFSILKWIIKQICCCNKNPNNHKYTKIKTIKPKTKAIFMLVMSLTFVNLINGCDEVTNLSAESSNCPRDEHGKIECTYDQTTIISVKPEHKTCLKLEDKTRNTTTKTLEITIVDLSVICEKQTEYFMRNYEITSESVKRCPSTGSCKGATCEKLNSDQKNPETSEKANNKPGYSYCVPSCGGWHCECFIATDGCLFYRTYMEEIGNDHYEVIKCNQWPIELYLKIDEGTISSFMLLSPGTLHTDKNMDVTLITTSIPPTPIFGSKFIINKINNDTIIVDNEGLLRNSIRCPDEESAKNFNCKFPPEACQCNSGDTQVHCECTKDPLPEMFSRQNEKLPTDFKGSHLTNDYNKLKAKLQQTSALQLQITLKGYKTEPFYDKSNCQIESKSLKGCYACKGADWTFKCNTAFGTALAKVKCPSQTVEVNCDTKNEEKTIQLTYNIEEVNENCSVSCPGGDSNVEIKGKLLYIPQQTEEKKISNNTNQTPTEGTAFDEIISKLQEIGKYLINIFKNNFWFIITILATLFTCLLLIFLLPILWPILWPILIKLCLLRKKNNKKHSGFGSVAKTAKKDKIIKNKIKTKKLK